MQIKPRDGGLAPRPTSVQPPVESAPPTAGEGPARDNVAISSAVRALAAALSAALPETDSAHVYELLTSNDRLMLTRALEFAALDQIDPVEVHGLVVDLYRYRARLRGPGGENAGALTTQAASHAFARTAEGRLPKSGVSSTELTPLAMLVGPSGIEVRPQARERRPDSLRASAKGASVLALPSLTSSDESAARSVLTALTLRPFAVDRLFVRELLDPDRTSTPSVRLPFLARLVVALAATHPEQLKEAPGLFARREARAALARAIEELALKSDALPKPSVATLARGRTLVKQRLLPMLFLSTRSATPSGKPGSAVLQSRRPAAPEQDVRFSEDERILLGALYVAAARQELDPRLVDRVARSLLALRAAEHAEQPETLAVQLSSMPPRRPSEQTSGATSSLSRPPSLAPSTGLELSDEPHASARGFGSASQIAARISGSYGSLAPPAPSYALGKNQGSPSVRPAHAHVPSAPRAPLEASMRAPMPTLTRPLDLAERLGLSGLVNELRAQKRRAPRERLRVRSRTAIAPVTPATRSAPEGEAEDPVFDGSRRRRRVRWQLLITRRKRQRARNP